MAKQAPISHEHFFQHATSVAISVTATPKAAPSKTSGSVGFLVNEKVTVIIGGVATPCMMNGNLTVIGSKSEAA